MKVHSLRQAVSLLVTGSLIGGCQWIRPSPKGTAPTPPAPMQYAPARDGLPTSKIWKSHIRFADINGDGFADIAAVSRLADGPYISEPDVVDLPRFPSFGGRHGLDMNRLGFPPPISIMQTCFDGNI